MPIATKKEIALYSDEFLKKKIDSKTKKKINAENMGIITVEKF